MNVLITGGAGFIGSYLVDNLSMLNTVTVVDDLSTGSMENIAHLKGIIEFYQDTILNKDLMLKLINDADVVYHLAAAVGVEYILDNPLESIKTNIQGTEIVLNLCSVLDKPVLITSSSEVYGKHTHAPLVETDNCIYGPSNKSRWSYAASKLVDEFTALAYAKARGLRVVIARLFNTTGPKQSDAYGMVIPRFVSQALNGEDLTVYGDGSQTRTFTHVDDVVYSLIRLMDTNGNYGEVFNVGGKEEVSILELARMIRKYTKSSSNIEFIPYDEAFEKDFEDMQRRVPSSKKLYKAIGYKPTASLFSIINDVIGETL